MQMKFLKFHSFPSNHDNLVPLITIFGSIIFDKPDFLYPIALIINLAKIGQGAQGGGQQADLAVVDGVAGIIGIVLGLIMSVVILIGAKKMMKLESYGFAMTTMILSMLPCFSPCCIFGLPIGIWGIIVLNDENVKAAFRRG